MRIEVALSLAADLHHAVQRIPDSAASEELARQVDQVQRRLRELDRERPIWLVEAVDCRGNRLRHVCIFSAPDRADALQQGGALLGARLAAADSHGEPYTLRARPCAPGELVYLTADQGEAQR